VCREALQDFPRDANLLCLSARAELALKNFDRAKQILEDVTRMHPDFAVAHDVSGDLLFAQGYAGPAIRAYEQALRLDPTRSATLTKIEKAKSLLAAALERRPATVKTSTTGRQMAFAEEMHNAEQLKKAGDKQRAEDIYRAVLKRDPNHVEAARMLARIASDNEQFEDAQIILRHALSNAPDYTRLWVDLANVHRELQQHEESLECAGEVLKLAPDMAESHVLHAVALGNKGLHKEAIEAYEKAIDISPERPAALCSMAHHLKTIGEQERAIETYRRSIATKPGHAEAYWSLANLKTYKFDESEVEAMEALLAGDEIADEARVQIHNAMGIDREARGDYDAAFRHLQQCNVLRRKSESYDPVDIEARIDRNIEVFSEEFLNKNLKAGNTDASPIFVIGLPRSGSTLIEQILASHSQVDVTHELMDLAHVAQRIRGRGKKKSRYPDSLADLSADDWIDVGMDYIDSTQKYRGDAPYFIDKNPNNFIFVGLIRLALPNAKVINARRHPLDSCFGSYKQLFASGQQFSYDLTEVGEYYLQYQRLVDHFHHLLPGFMLDVQYEQVVANLESEVRTILDHCGLPFEEECLRFHETERAVKTASSEQVRKPIYASSVNLWRNYELHLGELIETLHPLLASLPLEERPQCMQQAQSVE